MVCGITLELVGSSAGRRHLWRSGVRRLYSRQLAVGIRRDLSLPDPMLPIRVPVEVRRLQSGDDLSLVADRPGLTPEQARERADQRWLLRSGLPAPWVAVDPSGAVCVITWLLRARDNDAVRATLGPLLPPLKDDEVAIEGSFTAESHRGLGILPAMANQIAYEAKESEGARSALSFIAEWNASSLKAGEKAGWIPYAIREERYVLFQRRVRLLPFDDQTLKN